MIEKKFIHFARYETFLSKKLSADINNTTYTVGGIDGEVYKGEPDISYQSIVYIKDRKLGFTHGQIYDSSGLAEKLKEAVKINGSLFDGSEDIITELWGQERSFQVSDFTDTNSGKPVNVDGSGDVKLILPRNIDANVTNDSGGNNIQATYSTKQELTDALDELPSFLVYSSDTDTNPTLSNYPAKDWTTADLKNQHAGDYYITSTGRIFQFIEGTGTTSWKWREITDYYLYECQASLSKLLNKFNMMDKYDQVQNPGMLTSGQIYINKTLGSGYYVDVLCCNQNLNYNILPGSPTQYLPFIFNSNWTRTRTVYGTNESHYVTVDELSKIVGKTLCISNKATSGNLTINYGDSPKGTNQSVTIGPGKTGIFTFSAGAGGGYLAYYWTNTMVIDSPNVTWS